MNRLLQVALESIGVAARRRPSVTGDTPPAIPEGVVRQLAGDADLVREFARNARAAGANAEVLDDGNLATWLGALVERLQAHSVLIDPLLSTAREIARRFGERATVMSRHVDDERLFGADLAVVAAQVAVAETGSIVCTSGRQRWRGLSLVPPTLVAVVPADRIVADLCELFADLAPRAGQPADASNVNIITGPSRTADIEGIPVTGVHGPGRVEIAIVRDTRSSSA